MQSSVDTHCSVNVNWSVYDSKTRKVIFEKGFTSSVWENEESFRVLIFKCIDGSVKKLLSDDYFKEAVKKKLEEKRVETTSNVIYIPAVKACEKLADVVETAITIELGNKHGSGFIISSDGYALTNYHVVGEEKNVNVILSNGITIVAEVINVDQNTDVALIKLSGKGFKTACINLDSPIVGSNVVAVGTPGKVELGQSLSKGIISGKREIDGLVLIQTDVSISPGNSGGPLFNEQNQVIGIINSKLIGKGIEGVGFAIPITLAIENLELRSNN